MERMGEVVAVQGDLLVVQFCRPTDCEKCHGCMGGEAQRQLMVRGKAEIGDTAVVEMPTQKVLKASALAYAFPLLGMMGGSLFGGNLFPTGAGCRVHHRRRGRHGSPAGYCGCNGAQASCGYVMAAYIIGR